MTAMETAVIARVEQDAAPGGLFGSDAYLRASGSHDGARIASIVLGDVQLPALRSPERFTYTPYGYPQPAGDLSHTDWEGAATALAHASFSWRIALSPIGAGALLSKALGKRVIPSKVRPICVHDIDLDRAPLDSFAAKARGMVRRARRLGVRIEVGEPSREFGALYRAQMKWLGAEPVYFFADDYILGMRAAGGRQLIAHDAHGPAAGALFLSRGDEATYHLSWRRQEPRPPTGAVNLLVAAGLASCRNAGARLCYLGGGRSNAIDDPLLAFKASMATRIARRFTFESQHVP